MKDRQSMLQARFFRELYGRGCSYCGSMSSTVEFHHIDPPKVGKNGRRVFRGISRRYKMKTLFPELAKCTLLCREHHQQADKGTIAPNELCRFEIDELVDLYRSVHEDQIRIEMQGCHNKRKRPVNESDIVS